MRFPTVCYVLVSTHFLYIAVSLLASSRTTKQTKQKKKKMTCSDKTNSTTDGSFVRAIRTVHFAVADLIGREARGGVIGTRVLGWLAHSGLAGLFIGAVLAVDVPVAHPALCDTLACGDWDVQTERHLVFWDIQHRRINSFWVSLLHERCNLIVSQLVFIWLGGWWESTKLLPASAYWNKASSAWINVSLLSSRISFEQTLDC